ncbi:hypothetical protein K488DRAFT_83837 [Vararia minispora EC-137]|uniref:Uncharacterized protein n=1 Tax=Vararia minispora EC-137 TaxID=1314806 RepID=A0ACB8QSW0_9AGAM|nr:hypothetical protein K488DRAFT_83837 [Vararia minispora EC-137]
MPHQPEVRLYKFEDLGDPNKSAAFAVVLGFPPLRGRQLGLVEAISGPWTACVPEGKPFGVDSAQRIYAFFFVGRSSWYDTLLCVVVRGRALFDLMANEDKNGRPVAIQWDDWIPKYGRVLDLPADAPSSEWARCINGQKFIAPDRDGVVKIFDFSVLPDVKELDEHAQFVGGTTHLPVATVFDVQSGTIASSLPYYCTSITLQKLASLRSVMLDEERIIAWRQVCTLQLIDWNLKLRSVSRWKSTAFRFQDKRNFALLTLGRCVPADVQAVG